MKYENGTIRLRLEKQILPAAELGEESCVPDLLGEDILQNRLEFCLEEEDEIYEGYGRLENAYPYRQYNRYTDRLAKREVQTAVLENRHLRAVFLTEYGGRLWSLTDKRTGRNLLYTNDVLKFRNLAVRNAWFSGGVEWNIGVIGHTPFTTAPLYVAVLENEAGNDVLRMYEYERIRRVCYQMDFWLDEEDTFLNCRMRITNENETVVPMYWWSNMAVPEFEGGRILVPAKKAYTVADNQVRKVDIPLVNGVDVTHYQDIPKSVDYFFEISKERPKYIANVDKDGRGLLQVSTNRLQSRKLFSWGHGRASEHWQEFLTEHAGNYIEIQAGLAKTQYGCLPMAPHTAWEWMEQYGPADVRTTLLEEEIAARVCTLEARLKETKALAKTKGKLLLSGSGYGYYAKKKLAGHLEFVPGNDSLIKWAAFLKSGALHQPGPQERPDEFSGSEAVFDALKKSVRQDDRKNWYAHYQLGVLYCVRKERKKAKRELKLSYALEKNAWACHGLACVFYMGGNREKAAAWALRGLALEKEDVSYLKEMFRLLHLCGGSAEIVTAYERLDSRERRISRLKFYYIYAKYELGAYEEAFALLEADGGLALEDIREGEDSVETLWKRLQEALGREETEVPYRYLFKAF